MLCARVCRNGSKDSEENRTVVATARGVFDSNGGVLESKETGHLPLLSQTICFILFAI